MYMIRWVPMIGMIRCDLEKKSEWEKGVKIAKMGRGPLGILGRVSWERYIRHIWTHIYITRGSNGLTHSSDWRCAGWAATAPGNNPSRPSLWIHIGTASLGRAVRGSRWSMKGEKMPCAKS
jgi:hypothetical protein